MQKQIVLLKKLKVLYSIHELVTELDGIKSIGNLGFVPTMGALHEGHISLIERSISENTYTICSIYVNHKQFNNQEDFEKYPKTLASDIAKLNEAKCDFVFVPSSNEIYPANFIEPYFDLGNMEQVLEGYYRPGHFQGVCIVVNRLLDLIKPTKMYLGIKDYQQCMVIQKMLELQHLENEVELCFVSTVREENGLALSSRNMRLSKEAKDKAVILIACLRKAKQIIETQKEATDLAALKTKMVSAILNAGFESVDYFEFVNPAFELLNSVSGVIKRMIILTAASIEGVRLIDNIEININE